MKRYDQGKKRPPAEVAQQLDERMRKKAREFLSNSSTKPSSQSNLDGAESSCASISASKSALSAPSFPDATSGDAKPAGGSSASFYTHSEPSASSSNENRPSPAAIDDLEGATWVQMLPMLQHIEQETEAQELLEDVPKLRKWKEMSKPSHEVRDAMMKLGSRWEVKRYAQGKKRSPAEVAQELDERVCKNNKRIA